jgi:hypothetical protein
LKKLRPDFLLALNTSWPCAVCDWPAQLLDKDFQCTRHWYWADYDKQRRLGLAGPEKLAAEEKEATARAKLAEEARRAERIQQGLPPTEDFGAPSGARCCDVVLFGQDGWCGDATPIYISAYRATHKSIQSAIKTMRGEEDGKANGASGDAGEQQPLLA